MKARARRLFRHRLFGSDGFSLVEIMVGLVVAGIMIGFTMPEVAKSMRMHKLRTAATVFQTTLAKARSAAVTKGATVRIDYWPDSGFYVVREDQDNDGSFEILDGWGQIPKGIRVNSLNFGGQNWVSFAPDGVPSASGSIFVSTNSGIQREIRLAPGSGAVSIVTPQLEGSLTRG